MKYKIIKLHFNSPLHLHRGKGDYDITESILHSDTLSSAICTAGHKIYSEFDSQEMLENITLSSAFPFVGDIMFFPKPMIKLPLKIYGFDENSSSKEAKILKKLQYIDTSYFNKIINSDTIFEIPDTHLRVGGAFLSGIDIKAPFVVETQQRVTVARDNSESKPYYIERIHFAENSGLFFIIEYKDENLFEKILASLCFLGDEGIGTDRNAGNGHFTVKTTYIDIDISESDYRMSLSLYCPTKDEIKNKILDDSAYQLMKRGGYIAGAPLVKHRHLKKNTIYMFTEASVFKSRSPLIGKVINLRPDWQDDKLPNIWRSGKPFSIPIKTMKNE